MAETSICILADKHNLSKDETEIRTPGYLYSYIFVIVVLITI